MRAISVTFGLCIVCGAGAVQVLAGPVVRIHDIQGTGPASPMAGVAGITIEAVVVGDFQGASLLSGFFVQEQDEDVDSDPLSSEGIFVYDGGAATDVSIGDVVRVTGDVTEYYGLTELNRVTDITVVESGQLPEPAVVTLPVAETTDWERYEGMSIHIDQVMVVTGTANLARYGEVVLSAGQRRYAPTNVAAPGPPALAVADLNSRSSIQLDDGRTIADPRALPPYLGLDNTLRAGDRMPGLSGVLSFGFGAYEVQPVGPVVFERTNPRPPLSPARRATIKVVCLNVLNYFNGDGHGGGFPTSRGADTLEEFNRQTDKIVSAIASMDPDIAGLIEIENDAPPHSAIEDLTNALNSEYGDDAYDFIDTGMIGIDQIRVALIFKPDSVTPIGDAAILDSSVDPSFSDTLNRPCLAQTFRHNATDEVFTIVANHFKSKGSPCTYMGDPDAGDGQGNCNLTRTAAALALMNWLTTDPTGSNDPDFLVTGDFNAYAMEDPIVAMEEYGYRNLVKGFVADSDMYSYIYSAQSGCLDGAMCSPAMAHQVCDLSIGHINADEPAALDYNDDNPPGLYSPGAYRSSDHDPIVIILNPGATPGDLYPDGNIDTADLALLAANWLDSDCATCRGADLTGDGTVDLADLSIMAQNWLK